VAASGPLTLCWSRQGHTAVRRPTTTFTGAPPASYGQMLGFSASQGTRGIASDIMGFI